MKKTLAPFINVAGLLLLVPLLMLHDKARAMFAEACEHRVENGWFLLKGTCKKCGKELK